MSNAKKDGVHYHKKLAYTIENEGDIASVKEMSDSCVLFRFENGLQYKIHSPHIFFDKECIPPGEYIMVGLAGLLDKAIMGCGAQPGLWEMDVVHANYRSIVLLGSESTRVRVEYK